MRCALRSFGAMQGPVVGFCGDGLRYGRLLDGGEQRLGSMELNDYRYFRVARNGFNENPSR